MASLTRKNSSWSSPDARDGGTTDDGVADGDVGEDGADTKVGVTLRHPDLNARPYGLGVPATGTTGGCGAILLVLDPENSQEKHSMNKNIFKLNFLAEK
jgi:hypothetical protein